MNPRPFSRGEHSGRRASILRHGILRYRFILGAAVLTWVVSGEYGGALEHLGTRAGWLHLPLLLLLCVGGWVVGAGWLIGRGLWYLHEHPLRPDRRGSGDVRSGPADDR